MAEWSEWQLAHSSRSWYHTPFLTRHPVHSLLATYTQIEAFFWSAFQLSSDVCINVVTLIVFYQFKVV